MRGAMPTRLRRAAGENLPVGIRTTDFPVRRSVDLSTDREVRRTGKSASAARLIEDSVTYFSNDPKRLKSRNIGKRKRGKYASEHGGLKSLA